MTDKKIDPEVRALLEEALFRAERLHSALVRGNRSALCVAVNNEVKAIAEADPTGMAEVVIDMFTL